MKGLMFLVPSQYRQISVSHGTSHSNHQILDFCYTHTRPTFEQISYVRPTMEHPDKGLWSRKYFVMGNWFVWSFFWLFVCTFVNDYWYRKESHTHTQSARLLGMLPVQSNWTLVINNEIALHIRHVFLLWEICGCFMLTFSSLLLMTISLAFSCAKFRRRVKWNPYEKLKFKSLNYSTLPWSSWSDWKFMPGECNLCR